MKILILIGCLLLMAFTLFTSSYSDTYPSKRSLLFRELLAKGAHIIEDKYDLYAIGEGTGKVDEQANKKLLLAFQTKELYSKEKLRELLIKSAQDFVQVINANEKIQPFLLNTPYKIKDVEIKIFNTCKDGKEPLDPEISVAIIRRGIINYSTTDPEDTYKYKQEIKETYEEALAIVNKQ